MITSRTGVLAGACALAFALLAGCEAIRNPLATNAYATEDNAQVGWKRPDGGVATDAEYAKARVACTDEIKASSTDQIQSIPNGRIAECLRAKGWKSFEKR